MAHNLRRVGRALLSVSDKTGLVPFAQALVDRGVTLLSTGRTPAATTGGAGSKLGSTALVARYSSSTARKRP